MGITHRDLKPENVLLKSNDKNSVDYDVIKIADFGLSSLKVPPSLGRIFSTIPTQIT